ncbi:MAG: PIN domain-containing protein [Terracidiphilus sp.]
MSLPMKSFLDTSVLIAAHDAADERHTASRRLLASATPLSAACGAHTLAEVYAVLSRMPRGKKLRPELANTVVEQIRDRLTVVPLTADEYAATIRAAAGMGLGGGILFDALLLACARKVNAEWIYTWNARIFKMVAPDLAERITTP